jgi:hypothetical protein
MDQRRFDELTKALVAAKPSRREALRRLAGGALATVFGGLALEEASAQFGTEAFDLTCEQTGTKFYCSNAPANEVTTCKSQASGCVCAERREGGVVCAAAFGGVSNQEDQVSRPPRLRRWLCLHSRFGLL